MNQRALTMHDEQGLSQAEAEALLRRHGRNELPKPQPPGFLPVFARQFLSPLIYILAGAAAVSTVLSDIKDGIFITVVLLLNGMIGALQEYSAGKAAAALRDLEQPHATVIRSGHQQTIAAADLVPGDLVILESGGRAPADLRLVACDDLQCDESLMTGESAPVRKSLQPDAPGDHPAEVFAGTMVVRGRGRGIVAATGATTELGKIAGSIGERSRSQPPLMIRLERFSRNIALSVAVATALLFAAGLLRGLSLGDLFLMSVGLAVSAIPEGLPVAITVALAISMRRMSKVNVIVRNMTAIEALGSCTMIATDKTGTLTMNELTVTEMVLPEGSRLFFDTGRDLDRCEVRSAETEPEAARMRAQVLLRAAALPNEATLLQREDEWIGNGDTVDVALLAAARKAGIDQEQLRSDFPLLDNIPYEPDRRYAASFHEAPENVRIFVKGAPETLLAMADRMDVGAASIPLDAKRILAQKEELAARGLRVLAFAHGEIANDSRGYGRRHLINLVFLGLVGMKDPIRPEVPDAIRRCRSAGIGVAMITGDDPRTAAAIAAEAGIAFTPDQIATGSEITRAEQEGTAVMDALTDRARLYARVQPAQKLSIVLSLARQGHFVAMTGDGVNDAPALKHAHVGVAMGRKGTDVAKDSADIIITDDNFSSLVAGIGEGRVAYANIRKVIYMLISTGAAEVLIFLLAIPLGLPMPLLPVQLLWLNLVTNGIQDVMLGAEKAEGDEFRRSPRKPSEPILDRLMLRRVAQSTLVMGLGGFAVFYWLLQNGYSDGAARNMLLLLFVLFENVQTCNSRSERQSLFKQGFRGNLPLLGGVLAAQAIHVLCMQLPGISDVLSLQPVSLLEWGLLLALASTLLAVSEVDKWWSRRRQAAVR
ncbi:cation-translocating P-type ATPase [Rhizobium binxianense]